MWIWLLEVFNRHTGDFHERFHLDGISDIEVLGLLGMKDLGDGDIYDLPEESVKILGARFRIHVDLEEYEYLIGRGAPL